MEEYTYNEELDRQRVLNELYTKDKIILIRMIDFFNNIEAKYGYNDCIKFCKNHKEQFMLYKKKIEDYEKENTIY